jgi:RHS repeat-associated protein
MSENVTVTFNTGQPRDSGMVHLRASAAGTSDEGTVSVVINDRAVVVTPKGTTVNVFTGSYTQTFTVQNAGTIFTSYTLTPACSSPQLTNCSASATTLALAAGAQGTVNVSYDAATPGTSGTVRLTASYGSFSDFGSINVNVKHKLTVAVTPKGGTAEGDAGKAASVTFTIENNGTGSAAYALAATCSGPGVAGACTPDSTNVTIGPTLSKQVAVRFTAGASGTATIRLVATASADAAFADTGSVTFTAAVYAVAVTPDGQVVTASPYATETRTFAITNTGSTRRTFDVTTMCAPPAATGCSASASSVTLDPAISSTVNVTYQAGDPGATGTLRLVATDREGRSVNDGTLNLTVGTTVAQNVVRVNELNPGTSIDRSQCLTFAIVSDVASECGALRITHPLPSVRTLGKTRTPTLIYYSDHVHGPTLPVDVILSNSQTIPTTIRLIVIRIWPNGSRDTVTRNYTGSTWTSFRRQRIAAPPPTTSTRGTGIMRYTVEVRRVQGSTNALLVPAVSGEMAVVDRATSPFGGGWWLAGLEQLFTGQYDGSILWVGGDGSTRKYVKQPTLSGTDTVFLAAVPVDRPDTLLRRPDGKYRRQAGNGLFTEFDGFGFHRRTVTRLGYETVFNYDQSTRLSSIQVPPWKLVDGVSTPAHSYSFAYNATSTRLETITAPKADGQDRIVRVVPNGTTAGVRRITDVVGDSVVFGFQSGQPLRYAWRDDRRRTRTLFTVEASSPTIATFKTATGIDTTSIQHTFRTASGIGAGSVVATRMDSAYFRYDGPRPASVGDTTWFWVDRFGAPARIRNALNENTYAIRGDPRFPALVTESRARNGFTTWATYDARANLRATTQVNPRDDGKDAATMYEWHPSWDMMTKVVGPEGDSTRIGYDNATGDRVWQEDGRGSLSRVNFRYYTTTNISTGAVERLLKEVELPPVPGLAIAIESVRYDSVGNVDTTRTPRGAWTAVTTDAVGRPKTVSSRIYLDSAHVTSQHTTYDLYDRVRTTRSIGVTTNGIAQQEVFAENMYDAEGNLLSVGREASDAPGIGRITTQWEYDAVGRRRVEIAPDNQRETTHLDRAGNVDSVRTRRGHKVWMTYDRLNRLSTRRADTARYAKRDAGIALRTDLNSTCCAPVAGENPSYPRYGKIASRGDSLFVPGDSAAFAYDLLGNMTRADNRDARVRRTYYRNGQLKLDSLYTRTVTDTFFARHAYGLEHTYDRAGRRTDLKHPRQLVVGATYNAAQYTYDPLTGALATVRDVQGNQFTYKYNGRGELESLDMPLTVFDKYRYDQDGNLAQLDHGLTSGLVRETSIQYDARGKILRQSNAKGYKDVNTVTYSGLGHVVFDSIYAEGVEQGRTYEQVRAQRLRHDALGNLTYSLNTRRHKQINCPGSPCGYEEINSGPMQRAQAYLPGTGRYYLGENAADQADTAMYDPAGNTVFTTALWWVIGQTIEDRASYYAADGKLFAADYRWLNDNLGTDYWATTFEEYRYDALGRRVWLRSRRFSQANGNARIFEGSLSFVRRTVWDGNAELYEIQMPGWNNTHPDTLENDTLAVKLALMGSVGNDPNPYYGRVAYTHGLGIDRPLSIVRFRYTDQLSTSGNDIGWSGNAYPVFTVVPAWTARGRADFRFFPQTAGATQWGNEFCVAANRCAFVQVLAVYDVLSYSNWNDKPVTFAGTLLDDKRDKTGTWYRRNRSYDPATGRFTQEDPIGLAGGLNLYGFAGGDPVNFSDPFGLCKNPLGRGLASLQCVLEDAGAGARQAILRAASYVKVGVSGTMGHYTGGAGVSLAGDGYANHGIAINVPTVGASVDVGVVANAPAGALSGTIDVGAGKHAGFSVHFHIKDGQKSFDGVTLRIGTPSPIPVSPVGATIDLPTTKPKPKDCAPETTC